MESDARLRVARDVMLTRVHSLSPDVLARDAAIDLVRRGFSGAPVVDADGRLLGMVDDDDIIRTLAAAAYEEMPSETVADVMTTEVATADPEMDLFKLATLLHRNGLRRVPVVSEGRLVGLVAMGDLMLGLADVCDERNAEHVPDTMDAAAKTEDTHNPFPGHRTRKP